MTLPEPNNIPQIWNTLPEMNKTFDGKVRNEIAVAGEVLASIPVWVPQHWMPMSVSAQVSNLEAASPAMLPDSPSTLTGFRLEHRTV
jgi:hypothetical protein